MADVLIAVAEPNRRRILQRLADGPLTVNELAAGFTVTRSAISQHLRHLTDAGLVRQHKSGRHRIYRLDSTGMSRLRAEIDQFWTHELDALVHEAREISEAREDDDPEEDAAHAS